ncbi:MAG: hypothetical protein PHE50_05890, partial [Dehalococcoidales bacterium]|nr:hypothetical protein [Dehalococcoidales bacterium]
FQKREMPDDIPEYVLEFPPGLDHFGIDISIIMLKMNWVSSRSEASRLFKQGAIEVDGAKIDNMAVTVKDGSIIKVGKHRFVKIKIKIVKDNG